MKHFAPILLLVVATGCSPTSTEVEKPVESDPPPAVEEPGSKEPPSKEIVGLTLANEVDFPECKKDRSPGWVAYSISQTVLPCWKEPILSDKKLKLAQEKLVPNGDIRIQFDTTNTPQWIFGEANAVIIDGNLEQLALDTISISHQAELLTLLSDKWGSPHDLSIDKMQNGFGASFEGVKAFWDFDGFTITFHGITSNDGGIILVSTEKSREAFKATQGPAKSF